MAEKKFERSIFEIYFGYRALLDWTGSGGWKRGGGSISTGMFGTAGSTGQFGGKLSGPHQFKSGKRPRVNFWGQDNTSAKIPGKKGVYWDVPKPVPSGTAPTGRWDALPDSKDVSGTINAMLGELDAHSQQWLYLAAENMAAKGEKLLTKEVISKDELKRFKILLQIEERDRDPDTGVFGDLVEMTTRMAVEKIMMGDSGGDKHMEEMVRPMLESGIVYNEDTGQVVRIGSQVVTEGKESPGMRVMGTSMAKGAKVFPSGFGSHQVTPKQDAWLKTTADRRTKYFKRPDPNPYSPPSARVTAGEKQFRKMLTGVKGQWIDSFAASVIDVVGTKEGVQKLAGIVQQFVDRTIRNKSMESISDFTQNISAESGGMGYYGIGGSKEIGPASGTLKKKGGQTPQELAAIFSGTGTGEFLTEGGSKRGIGKGIDVKFKEFVKLPMDKIGSGRRPFKRADLTTSFFREGKHHGIGSASSSVGKRKLPPNTSIVDSEDFIRKYYQNNRIPQYNALIRMVMSATNTDQIGGKPNRGAIYEARQKWAHKSKKKTLSYTDPRNSKNIIDTGYRGKGQALSLSSAEIKKVAVKAGVDLASDSLSKDLEWVLHHMANMLPGGKFDSDPYAMTTPFQITDNDVGTLFVVFDINNEGFYRDMDMNPSDGVDGSYVYIDSRAPMFWLYDKARAEGYKGTFFQFADMGSMATAGETLHTNRETGLLFRKFDEDGNNLRQQITFSKISAPEVSETLRLISNMFFDTIGDQIHQKVNQTIHDDAVRYSVWARNPGASQMSEMEKWYNFATEYLMTRRMADAKMMDYMKTGRLENLETGASDDLYGVWKEFDIDKKHRKDPFWYLWAAPYISRKRVEWGGAQTGYIED